MTECVDLRRINGVQEQRKGTYDMSAGITSTIRPSSNVRTISTPDGAALLDIDAGTCYSLNPVGAIIWEQFQLNSSGIGIEAILQHIEKTCSVSRQEIQEDIVAYIQNLERRRLVISSSNGGGPKTH